MKNSDRGVKRAADIIIKTTERSQTPRSVKAAPKRINGVFAAIAAATALALFLVSLSACGKTPAPTAESTAAPTETVLVTQDAGAAADLTMATTAYETTETSSVMPSETAARVETTTASAAFADSGADSYSILYAAASGSGEGTLFNGYGVGEEYSAGWDTQDVAICVKDAAGNAVARFVLRTLVGNAFTEIHGESPSASLAARNGNRFLIAVRADVGQNETYYLYNADADRLTPLGFFADWMSVGTSLCLRGASYYDGAVVQLLICDWNGQTLCTNSQLVDWCEDHGALYLLVGQEHLLLYRISAALLSGSTPFYPETVHMFSQCRASFVPGADEALLRVTDESGTELGVYTVDEAIRRFD